MQWNPQVIFCSHTGNLSQPHKQFVSPAQQIYLNHTSNLFHLHSKFISTTQAICFTCTRNLSQPHKQFVSPAQEIYLNHTSNLIHLHRKFISTTQAICFTCTRNLWTFKHFGRFGLWISVWTVGEAESVFFLSMKGLRIRHLITKYKIDSHLLKPAQSIPLGCWENTRKPFFSLCSPTCRGDLFRR